MHIKIKNVHIFLRLLPGICLLLLPLLVFSQNETDEDSDITTVYIMKLKPGIAKTEASINDTATFTLKPGEPVLYDMETNMAFAADGRFGKISPERLHRVDTAYFKFTYSRTNFLLRKGDPLYDAAAAMKININKTFLQVRLHDFSAMSRLFKLGDTLDTPAATEEYATFFWALVNTWSDKDFAAYLRSLDDETRGVISYYLSDGDNTYPVENPSAYFKLYYPESWKIIEANAE